MHPSVDPCASLARVLHHRFYIDGQIVSLMHFAIKDNSISEIQFYIKNILWFFLALVPVLVIRKILLKFCLKGNHGLVLFLILLVFKRCVIVDQTSPQIVVQDVIFMRPWTSLLVTLRLWIWDDKKNDGLFRWYKQGNKSNKIPTKIMFVKGIGSQIVGWVRRNMLLENNGI